MMDTSNGPSNVSAFKVALAWERILDQDKYWVPKSAWVSYFRAFEKSSQAGSFKDKEAAFKVEGVILIAKMDTEYQTKVLGFMKKKLPVICATLFGEALLGSFATDWDDIWVEEELAINPDAQDVWFNKKPFVRRLLMNLGAIPDPEVEWKKEVEASELVDDADIDFFYGCIDIEGENADICGGHRRVKYTQELGSTDISASELASFLTEASAATGDSNGLVSIEGQSTDVGEYGYGGEVYPHYELTAATFVYTGVRPLTKEERFKVKEHLYKQRKD